MEKKSLFWPLFLIAAGAVWLMVQMGRIPTENLWALTYLWPFLLIGAGVSLILKSFWKYAPMLVDVILIGGAVLAIFYAAQIGWDRAPMAWLNFDGDGVFMGPAERGSGNVVTETRKVSDFHAIEVNYPAQVLVKQGKTESLEIEAEDNLLPRLRTRVRNEVLEISYKRQDGKHVNPTEMVKITIVVKDLDDIEFTSAGELVIEKLKTETLDVSLSGAGNLELNEIDVKSLEVDLTGAGSLAASGKADELDLQISGFGGFDGEDLRDQKARVNISGAGSATVWVEDDLNAQISGAGSISYYGSASVQRQISGVGGVNHLGNK